MQTYVCLLRAINVGGNNIIKMKELVASLESIGLISVKFYLQSGNIIFQANEDKKTNFQSRIENLIKERFDLSIRVFIYTKYDWYKISDDNPYTERDKRQQYITFTEKQVTNEDIDSIKVKMLEDDLLIYRDKTLYFYFPNGYGTTKINNQFLEKSIKTLTTTRNRNTVDKIREMIEDI